MILNETFFTVFHFDDFVKQTVAAQIHFCAVAHERDSLGDSDIVLATLSAEFPSLFGSLLSGLKYTISQIQDT